MPQWYTWIKELKYWIEWAAGFIPETATVSKWFIYAGYIPALVLNSIYSIFVFMGSGFSEVLFKATVVNGHLTWQFTWGTLSTVIGAILGIAVVSWVIILLWKTHKRNELRKFGDRATTTDHIKYGFGLLVFLFVSPFLMMLFSTLTTILISIFNTNQVRTISSQQISGLLLYANPDLNNFSTGLMAVSFGEQSNLINSLTNLQTQLNQLVKDATDKGRTDIVNIANDALTQINAIIPYLTNDFTKDVNDLMGYLSQIRPETIDTDLAYNIETCLAHFQIFQIMCSSLADDLSSLNVDSYKTIINSWGTYAYDLEFWPVVEGYLNSWNSSEANTLGFFLNTDIEDFTCLFSQIINGTDNYIGIGKLNGLLTGEIEFTLTNQLFYLLTSGSSSDPFAFTNTMQIDDTTSLVLGIILTWISIVIMMYGVFKIAKCWTLIIIDWFAVPFVFAKGDELGVKRYASDMFSLFLEVLFCYIFAEIILIIVPEIANVWTDQNTFDEVGTAASVIFTDAGLGCAFLLSGKLARNIIVGEESGYYTSKVSLLGKR